MALTKDDLQSISALLDPIRQDIQNIKSEMATKQDVEIIFKELMKYDVRINKLEDKADKLSAKVDTLLLQSDNTALLLNLHTQQSGEILSLKMRVEALDKKLA